MAQRVRRGTWLLALVLVAFLAPVVGAEDPTVYEGRDATAWAGDLVASNVDLRRKAIFALWHLGTNARTEVRSIARAIRDDDQYVRTTANRVLTRFDWQKSINTLTTAIPELIDALEDERAEVRVGAANLIWLAGPIPNVVGGDPPPAALVPALMNALDDEEPKVRANAAASLANLQKSAIDALPKLAKALQDPDPRVRQWTLRALGWIDAGTSAKLIVSATKDEDASVRLSAIEALASVPATEKETVLPVLRDLLESEVQAERLGAVNAVWALGQPETLPWLTERLRSDPDPAVRATAASAVGAFGAPESVPHLMAALDDDDPRARAGAAGALGRLGPEAAAGVPKLIALLESDDAAVRSGAAMSLSVLAHYAAPAIPALVRALEDEDATVRLMGGSALAQLVVEGSRDERIFEAFMAALDDDDAMVRQYAVQSVGAYGAEAKDAVPAMIAVYPKQGQYDQRAVFHAFTRMGPAAAEAAPFLRTCMTASDGNRLAAASALAAVSTDPDDVEAAVELLISALAEDATRLEAITRLGHAGPPARKATLFLRVWMKSDDWKLVSAGALLQIGHEGVDDARAVLIEALDGDRARGAISFLADAGANEAIPALLPIAGDPAHSARSTALTALIRLGATGPEANQVFESARKDASAWIRMLGARGLNGSVK